MVLRARRCNGCGFTEVAAAQEPVRVLAAHKPCSAMAPSRCRHLFQY